MAMEGMRKCFNSERFATTKLFAFEFRGDLCDLDMDNDGINNHADNCPIAYNPDQVDANRKFT